MKYYIVDHASGPPYVICRWWANGLERTSITNYKNCAFFFRTKKAAQKAIEAQIRYNKDYLAEHEGLELEIRSNLRIKSEDELIIEEIIK